MWSFWVGLLFIHGLPSIKAIPFLSYTSVLISTKITTALSLWDPSKHQLKGLNKLKDWDYLWVQHISWSLVLLSGQNHGTFTSPSEVPATSQFCIRFQCGSVLNSEVENNEINAQCIPCDIWQKMQVLSGGIQSTLDNVLEVSKGPKEFSSEALLHSLTQLVTCDDQVSEIGLLKGKETYVLLKAFALVSKAVFRNCLVVMRPKTRTKEFLGPYDIETHLQNEYIKFMDQIKQAIQVSAIYLITRWCVISYHSVNTQIQTHTPFCCSQAPRSSHNPINFPSLAKALLTTHIQCDVPAGGNRMAAFLLFSSMHPGDW